MIKGKAKYLKELVDRVKYAVSTDETRPHIQGVFFEQKGESLTLVATDGHRLVKMEVENAGYFVSGDDCKTMIPHPLLMYGLADAYSDVQIDVGTLDVVFGSRFPRHDGNTEEQRTLSLEVTGLAYPPYEQVIPQCPETIVQVSRKALVKVLNKLDKIKGNTSPHGIKLTIQQGSDCVYFESQRSGEIIETVDFTLVSASVKYAKVGLNLKYAKEAVSKMKSDMIEIRLDEDLDPVMFVGKDYLKQREETLTATVTCVVMPMRI